MNMLEITKAAIAAAREFYKQAGEDVQVSYSASERGNRADNTIYYMMPKENGDGKIKHENYDAYRAMALRAAIAIMDEYNKHGILCEISEFHEFDYGFHIKADSDIAKNVIHTKEN